MPAAVNSEPWIVPALLAFSMEENATLLSDDASFITGQVQPRPSRQTLERRLKKLESDAAQVREQLKDFGTDD